MTVPSSIEDTRVLAVVAGSPVNEACVYLGQSKPLLCTVAWTQECRDRLVCLCIAVAARIVCYLLAQSCAALQDKNNRETSGFKSRMGAAAPRPRLLRLRPEDAAKVGGAPLRQGKFTWVTEAGRQERWIVASCGSNTVLWNFRRVPPACARLQRNTQNAQSRAAPGVVSENGLP